LAVLKRVLIVDDEKVTNDLPLGKSDGNAPATGGLTLRGVEHEALAKAARKEAGK
jgi:hypothetical protein